MVRGAEFVGDRLPCPVTALEEQREGVGGAGLPQGGPFGQVGGDQGRQRQQLAGQGEQGEVVQQGGPALGEEDRVDDQGEVQAAQLSGDSGHDGGRAERAGLDGLHREVGQDCANLGANEIWGERVDGLHP